MKPVYLYGFMGCGKSYVGRRLSRETGAFCVDLDEFIAGREGMEIAEIFAKHGKEYFKNLELSALKEVKADVISLGGGSLLENPEAAAYAKENAVVIFIDTDFDTCYERIKSNGAEKRPNAAGKTKEKLCELYKSRLGHYKKVADYTAEGEDICSFITQKLRLWQEQT
ncbi:MAG: shikimate kinase [Oscillospiraceae bacterium]|jgi:shikimate kinase|nr:shikimate kinase [Oscillospiraceae bacterium]